MEKLGRDVPAEGFTTRCKFGFGRGHRINVDIYI